MPREYYYDVESETERYRRERTHVNVALWQDQLFGDTNKNPSCKVCKVKLISVDDGVFLFCKECGQKTPTKEIKQEKKLIQKHGSAKGQQGPILASQKRKDRKRTAFGDTDELDEETKGELRSYGYAL